MLPASLALRFEEASLIHGPGLGMSQEILDGHKECLEGGAESARMISLPVPSTRDTLATLVPAVV